MAESITITPHLTLEQRRLVADTVAKHALSDERGGEALLDADEVKKYIDQYAAANDGIVFADDMDGINKVQAISEHLRQAGISYIRHVEADIDTEPELHVYRPDVEQQASEHTIAADNAGNPLVRLTDASAAAQGDPTQKDKLKALYQATATFVAPGECAPEPPNHNDKMPAREINAFQRRLLELYPGIDTLAIDINDPESVDATVRSQDRATTGDTLFNFLWLELGDAETSEEAEGFLSQARRDLDEIADVTDVDLGTGPQP